MKWNIKIVSSIQNVTGLILCKFSILFSTEKFELGHNFSQFIYRFNIGIFEYWS